jgi:hypothetical protein
MVLSLHGCRNRRARARSEVSSIDTAFLLAGVLTARACFSDNAEIDSLETELFNNVDFPWMMNASQEYFSNGWMPEKGFLPAQWNSYSELLILYVPGIGSPTHPISGASWDQWKISLESDCGYTYIGGGPLCLFTSIRSRGLISATDSRRSRRTSPRILSFHPFSRI